MPTSETKPVAEITHEEHKKYLIREAEENEKLNDELYKLTEESIAASKKAQEEASAKAPESNDEIRAKALEAAKAAATK